MRQKISPSAAAAFSLKKPYLDALKTGGAVSVAIISHNRELNDIISKRLASLGFYVKSAYDGQEGFFLISEGSFDAVVIDDPLNGMSGMDILQKFESVKGPARPAFILLTAANDTHTADFAMARGFNATLTKPTDAEFLAACIDSLAEQRKKDLDGRCHARVKVPHGAGYADKFAAMVLARIGIKPKLLGYSYLRSVIASAVTDRTILSSTTKGLYPFLGEKHGVTPWSAERSMRYAISDVYATENGRRAFEFLGINAKPTNTKFIAACVRLYDMMYETGSVS